MLGPGMNGYAPDVVQFAHLLLPCVYKDPSGGRKGKFRFRQTVTFQGQYPKLLPQGLTGIVLEEMMIGIRGYDDPASQLGG